MSKVFHVHSTRVTCVARYVAGAALSLAARSHLGRAELDALRGVRGIRAAMVAQPQLDYGGVFKDLKPWLDADGDGGGDGSSERIIAERVAAARATAAREANVISSQGSRGGRGYYAADVDADAATPTPFSPGRDGGGEEPGGGGLPAFGIGAGAGGRENSPGAANGATPHSPGSPGSFPGAPHDASVVADVDLSGVGGVWFAFQQHQVGRWCKTNSVDPFLLKGVRFQIVKRNRFFYLSNS